MRSKIVDMVRDSQSSPVGVAVSRYCMDKRIARHCLGTTTNQPTKPLETGTILITFASLKIWSLNQKIFVALVGEANFTDKVSVSRNEIIPNLNSNFQAKTS